MPTRQVSVHHKHVLLVLERPPRHYLHLPRQESEMMPLPRTVYVILLQMHRNQNYQKNHNRDPRRKVSLHLSSKLVFCFLCCNYLLLRKTLFRQIRHTRFVIRKKVSKPVSDQNLRQNRQRLPKLAYVQMKPPKLECGHRQQKRVSVHLLVSVMEDHRDQNAWQKVGPVNY